MLKNLKQQQNQGFVCQKPAPCAGVENRFTGANMESGRPKETMLERFG